MLFDNLAIFIGQTRFIFAEILWYEHIKTMTDYCEDNNSRLYLPLRKVSDCHHHQNHCGNNLPKRKNRIKKGHSKNSLFIFIVCLFSVCLKSKA